MKKSLKIVVPILVLLIIARMVLPHFLLKEVNKVLADLDGYHGSMADLDLHLYRGAYQFEGIKIEKIDGEMKAPFFEVDLIDISIDWNAVFKGKLVGDVEVTRPILNFAIDSTSEVAQTGAENDWLKTIEEIIPFEANVNLFAIHNGTLEYSDYSQLPNVKVAISNINAKATNLSNVVDESKKFPASFNMTATSDGDGKLELISKLNFLKEVPDFDLSLKLEEVNLVELNDFTNAYGKFDFEEGQMSLYSEILMENGTYDGYIKPVIENVKILSWKDEKDDGFFRKIWEGIVSIPTEMLENQDKDRVATKTPISGTIEKLDTSTWKTIVRLFKNAFVKAIPKKLDSSLPEEPDKE